MYPAKRFSFILILIAAMALIVSSVSASEPTSIGMVNTPDDTLRESQLDFYYAANYLAAVADQTQAITESRDIFESQYDYFYGP